jgi:hypothetical protein
VSYEFRMRDLDDGDLLKKEVFQREKRLFLDKLSK